MGNRRQLVMWYPLVVIAVAVHVPRACHDLAARRATAWFGRSLAALAATAGVWFLAASLLSDLELAPLLGRGGATVDRLRERIARDGGGIAWVDQLGTAVDERPAEEVEALVRRLGLRRVPGRRGDAGAVWSVNGLRPPDVTP